jgi:hypothetical protein
MHDVVYLAVGRRVIIKRLFFQKKLRVRTECRCVFNEEGNDCMVLIKGRNLFPAELLSSAWFYW